jgi:thiamine biosynthesis lipoprotein
MVVVAVFLGGCGGGEVLVIEGEAMGMRWRVQVLGGEAAGIREEVVRVMNEWEMAASLWREDSEIAQVNREPEGKWIKLGERLWSAVALAREVARETDGALDITVGPLVEIWGFGSEGGRERPSEQEVQRVLSHCGWRHLEFDDEGCLMRKLTAGVELNVNGVVEGLALEELARGLRVKGYRDFLLEIGGELLAEGRSTTGNPWMVAVQVPGGGAKESFSMMPLSDMCLATSGTYRHLKVEDGKDFSHLIDPVTGRPVAHQLTSVSVMDADCGRADGFATALLVLGPEKGRVVAERLGLRVIWIEAVK